MTLTKDKLTSVSRRRHFDARSRSQIVRLVSLRPPAQIGHLLLAEIFGDPCFNVILEGLEGRLPSRLDSGKVFAVQPFLKRSGGEEIPIFLAARADVHLAVQQENVGHIGLSEGQLQDGSRSRQARFVQRGYVDD